MGPSRRQSSKYNLPHSQSCSKRMKYHATVNSNTTTSLWLKNKTKNQKQQQQNPGYVFQVLLIVNWRFFSVSKRLCLGHPNKNGKSTVSYTVLMRPVYICWRRRYVIWGRKAAQGNKHILVSPGRSRFSLLCSYLLPPTHPQTVPPAILYHQRYGHCGWDLRTRIGRAELWAELGVLCTKCTGNVSVVG